MRIVRMSWSFWPLIGICVASYAQVESVSTLQRNAALRTIKAGDPMGAASSLLSDLRTLHAEDPYVAESATGSLQLLMFSVTYLMDDASRDRFVAENLNPEKSEFDAFIVTLRDAFSLETEEQTEEYLARLMAFTDSQNNLISISALGLLADPYYSLERPIGDEARQKFAERYPDLQITRMVLSLPLYFYSKWPGGAANWARACLDKEQIPGLVEARPLSKAEKEILAKGSFMATLSPILDDLHRSNLAARGVEALTKLLREDGDWINRYGYLRVLEPFMKKPSADADGYWKQISPTLRILADRKPVTPDVYRAWVMLCRNQSERATILDIGFWANRLLTEQERPCEPVERILYEEGVQTYQQYADALQSKGYVSASARAYERLAEAYPGSALSAQARLRAEKAYAEAQTKESPVSTPSESVDYSAQDRLQD